MISTSANYALRAVMHIAQQQRWCTNDDVCVATAIPRGYLAKILSALAEAGILQSQRGLNGGFRIGRDPTTIDVLSIVRAIDLPSVFGACATCKIGDPVQMCIANRLIARVQAQADETLRMTTLQDLLAQCG